MGWEQVRPGAVTTDAGPPSSAPPLGTWRGGQGCGRGTPGSNPGPKEASSALELLTSF